MANYDFDQIRKIILDWGKVLKTKYPNRVEEIKNSQNVLILDFCFENCLAQIIIDEPTFAPYEYVSFEALDSKKPLDSPDTQLDFIYVYYDSEHSTIKETLGMLDYGFNYCLDYIPDKLAQLYIGKRGIIDSEKSDLTALYPDDINIVFNKNEAFECMDVQYQYLVVSNKKWIVRVLPEAFIVIA